MSCRWVVAVVSVIVMMTACGDSQMKPRSKGKPFSVVVTGEDTRLRNMVAKTIGDVEVDRLPQREKAYQVNTIATGEQSPEVKYARVAVVVGVDNSLVSPKIRYEKDVHATPQMMVRLTVPSADEMVKGHARIASALNAFIGRFETNVQLRHLRKAHSPAREKEVERATGVTMLIPADIAKTKKSNGFIWLSDDGGTTMRNICVYVAKGTDCSAERLLKVRDSVMQRNVKGEADSMYMTTVRNVAPLARVIDHGGRRIVEMRGLWEMKGDAMGGPFVSHTLTDSLNNRIVTAEAFVYAPGEKKRDVMKRLEAALFTVKIMK